MDTGTAFTIQVKISHIVFAKRLIAKFKYNLNIGYNNPMMITMKQLFKERKARKIFGKKEVEIILKQLKNMPVTQPEKNRLSRDIRPKLEFIRELSQFKDEFRLEKNQSNKKLMESAVAEILNDELKDRIHAVLLFGSFADNTSTPHSDIDLCVVFDKDITAREATLFRMRVLGRVPEKVDVQVFNALPQKIKVEIAKNHRVLFRAGAYDNVLFTIRHIKDQDYFIRMRDIFGAEA